MQKVRIPIVYAYLYHKLKERSKGIYISHTFIKRIIQKTIICSHTDGKLTAYGTGGNKKGIPRCYLNEIIEDMINLNLILKLGQNRYQLLKNACEKQLKKFIW